MRIKTGKTSHQWITMSVVFSLCFPPFVIAASSPSSQATIQLGRSGSWNSNQQPFYSDLARQVQLWIEDTEGGGIRVSNKNYRIESKLKGVEQTRFELRRTTELLKERVVTSREPSSLEVPFQQMLRARRKASQIAALGPEIRDSLFWEGAYYWGLKKTDLSTKALERAVKIHPSGLLPEVGEWDTDEKQPFNRVAFESFVEKVKSKVIRNCSVSLDVSPREAQVWVNGFHLASDPQLWLSPGESHHLEIEGKGYLSQTRLISCHSPERQRLSINLAQKKSNTTLSEREDVTSQSVVLIEPTDNLIKLFLYTPGKYLDEIPLSREIKLTEAGMEGTGNGSPIVSDAMLSLFRKHELIAANFKVPTLTDAEQGSSGLKPQLQLSHREKSWLDSPVFWGIVGGVLLGGAITYFATRDNQAGSTTSDWE